MTFDEQNIPAEMLSEEPLTVQSVVNASMTTMQRIRQERQQFLQKQRFHQMASLERVADISCTKSYSQEICWHTKTDFPLEQLVVNPSLPLRAKYPLRFEYTLTFMVGITTVFCVLALSKDLWMQVSPVELFFSLLMTMGCVMGFLASCRLLRYRLLQHRLHVHDGVYFSASALMIRQRGQWEILPRHLIQQIDMTPKRSWWPENWRQTQYLNIAYQGLSNRGCSTVILHRQSHRQLRRLIYSWLDNRSEVWQHELQATEHYFPSR